MTINAATEPIVAAHTQAGNPTPLKDPPDAEPPPRATAAVAVSDAGGGLLELVSDVGVGVGVGVPADVDAVVDAVWLVVGVLGKAVRVGVGTAVRLGVGECVAGDVGSVTGQAGSVELFATVVPDVSSVTNAVNVDVRLTNDADTRTNVWPSGLEPLTACPSFG